MEQMNHHDAEHDTFSDIDRLPHLAPVHAPDTLLPALLARLERAGAHFSGEPSLEAYLAALYDPAWQVRAGAIQGLAALGARVPIETLVAAMDDEDASVRAAAIRALGSLGERAPLESLVAALQDPEWPVREIAALTLGSLGKRAPVEALVAAVHDENVFVCRAAALALVQAHFATVSTPVAQTQTVKSLQKQNRSRPSLRLLQGLLATLLVIVGMLFAWLPRVQHLTPLSPVSHHTPAVLFTYQGGQGIEGSPVWPSESKYLALLSSFGYSVEVLNVATGNMVQNPSSQYRTWVLIPPARGRGRPTEDTLPLPVKTPASRMQQYRYGIPSQDAIPWPRAVMPTVFCTSPGHLMASALSAVAMMA